MRRLLTSTGVLISLVCVAGFTAPVACFHSSSFVIDLSGPTLPATIVATARTGDPIWAATSATSIAQVSGAGVYENRGGLGGWWSFPAYSNLISAPFAHGSSPWATSGTVTVTAEGTTGAPTGPDGVSESGATIADADTSTWVLNGVSASPSTAASHSGWARVNAVNPPTSPGGMYLGGGGVYGYVTPSGPAWQRWYSYAAGQQYHGYSPAGMVPSPDPYTSPAFVNSATGAMDVWGSQMLDSVVDLPLANTSVGAQDYTFASSVLPRFAGDLDVQGRFTTSLVQNGQQQQPDGYLWSESSTDGLAAVRIAAGSFVATARGSDVFTGFNANFGYGQEVTWRFVYAPSSGTALLRITYNGVYQDQTEVRATATGSALAQPSAAYLGSNVGSDYAAVQHRQFSFPRGGTGALIPEFVVLGDSIVGALSNYALTPSYIYTASEARTRAGIVDIAVPGNKVNDQIANWNASSYSGSNGDGLKVAIVMVGINDIAAGTSAATIEGYLQTLVNTLKADHPSMKVILCTLTPAKRQLDTINVGYYSVWQTLNTDIRAGVVTGTDLLSDSARAATEDGTTGNLYGPYDKGDGIHPDNPGRQAIGEAWRGDLQSLGEL